MGWEQVAPAIQAAFDTYWRRKEGQEGRAHDKELLKQRLLHDEKLFYKGMDRDALMAEIDKQFQAQENEKTRKAEDKRRREELEFEEKKWEERGMRDLAAQSYKTWAEDKKTEDERAYKKGVLGEERQHYQDVTRPQELAGIEDMQAFELERARIMAAGAGAGKEFSPGGLALEIQAKADEANALFKMGWADFSKVFPRLISKDTYDTLKATGKDKVIADYLLAEISKQYIRMFESEALDAGVNLPKELNYLLNIPDDFMETIQAEWDAEVAAAEQKKATRKEKWKGKAEEWRTWRTGPSPSDKQLGIDVPWMTKGYEKFGDAMKKIQDFWDRAWAGEENK